MSKDICEHGHEFRMCDVEDCTFRNVSKEKEVGVRDVYNYSAGYQAGRQSLRAELREKMEELVEELNRYVETSWQEMYGGDLIDIDPETWLRNRFAPLLSPTDEVEKCTCGQETYHEDACKKRLP